MVALPGAEQDASEGRRGGQKRTEPLNLLPEPFEAIIPNAAAIAEATEPDRNPKSFTAKYTPPFAKQALSLAVRRDRSKEPMAGGSGKRGQGGWFDGQSLPMNYWLDPIGFSIRVLGRKPPLGDASMTTWIKCPKCRGEVGISDNSDTDVLCPRCREPVLLVDPETKTRWMPGKAAHSWRGPCGWILVSIATLMMVAISYREVGHRNPSLLLRFLSSTSRTPSSWLECLLGSIGFAGVVHRPESTTGLSPPSNRRHQP